MRCSTFHIPCKNKHIEHIVIVDNIQFVCIDIVDQFLEGRGTVKGYPVGGNVLGGKEDLEDLGGSREYLLSIINH